MSHCRNGIVGSQHMPNEEQGTNVSVGTVAKINDVDKHGTYRQPQSVNELYGCKLAGFIP